MNIVAGDTRPEKNWAPKLGVVHVVVELARTAPRPALGGRTSRPREAAVGLLDVGVEPAGVGPLRDEHRCERRAIARVTTSDSGTVTTVISASSGEMVSIITSTATTVSTAVSSWLIVIDSDVWMLSTSLVTRLSSSPRCRESK